MTPAPGPYPNRVPPAPGAGAAEEHLKHFCAAVLDLLHPGPAAGHVLATIAPALVRAIREGSQATVAELRRELDSWEAASDHLRHLVESPFLHLGDEAAAMLARLEGAQEQAVRVVALLEALQPPGPRLASADGRRTLLPFSLHRPEEPPPDVLPHRGCPPVVQADTAGDGTGECRAGPAAPGQEQAAALCREAEARWQAQDFRAAEGLYTEALRLDPDSRLAYLRRGRARLFQAQPDEAVADLTRALELDAEDPVGYWWRGDAYAAAGRHEEAVADYGRALAFRPDILPVRYNRAIVLRQCGDLDRSLAELDQLVRRKPAFAPLYYNRGLIYLARGDLPRAAAEFRTTLQHQPDFPQARRRLREIQSLLDARQPEQPAPSGGPLRARADTPTVTAAPLERTARTPPCPSPPVPRAPAAPAAANRLAVQCPGCGQSGGIRWDRLGVGKVLTCPHCRRNLTAKADGRLAEVVRGRNGRWVERGGKEAGEGRSRHYRLLAGAFAAVLLAVLVVGVGKAMRGAPPAEASLPQELTPRAELFARAWLKGDYTLMRRLTDPMQDRLLFSWYRRNPAPRMANPEARAEDVKLTIQSRPGPAHLTALRVRFDGLAGPRGGPVELRLMWEERGGHWLFQPVPKGQPRARG